MLATPSESVATRSATMRRVVFTAPQVAGCEEIARPAGGDAGVLLRNEVSVVSAGTELACLAGQESWAPLPYGPGYGSVGVVAGVPAGGKSIAPGDRVFTYGKHADFTLAESVIVPVPAGVKPEHAAFARLAAVAMTAVRVSRAELGDRVAVFGLGLVGNFACQLFALAGCRVIGIDLDPERRELARRVGVAEVLAPGDDIARQVKELTGGRGCEVVVEAAGAAAVAEIAAACVGSLGELILLGTPRAPYQTDLTPFLQRSHIYGLGCVTIKGAHEWRYPVLAADARHEKHSIERNVAILLDLIAAGRLQVEPLLQRVARPEEAGDVYENLRLRRTGHLGVVFDWRT